MAYHTIIFDLDGTLADTSPGILETLRVIEEQLALPPCSDEEIRSIIGPPLQESFIRLYDKTYEEADEIAKIYRHYYDTHDMAFRACLQPGMQELLKYLKENGVPMAVATHKVVSQTTKALKAFGITHFFETVRCYDEESNPTKGQLILQALEDMGVTDRSGVLMVGDSIYDSEGAAEAGVDFAALTCGFGFGDPKVLAAFPSVVQAKDGYELFEFIKANLAVTATV